MATMTIGQWHANNYNMIWSIRNKESAKAFDDMALTFTDDTWKQHYDEMMLDFTAPNEVPDGTYRVRYTYVNRVGESEGVVIENGAFVPAPTEAAVFQAVCQTFGLTPQEARSGPRKLSHICIENFRWNQEHNCLEVGVGS